MRSLALLALLLPAVAAGSAPGVSSPLLLWSNRGYLGAGSGQAVSYQSVVSAADATSKLVLGAAGKLTDEFAQKLLNSEELQSGATVLVYLGSQLDAADMRRSSAATAKLNSLLEAATSSLVMPYAAASLTRQGAGRLEALTATLSEAGLPFQVVGCDGADASIGDALEKAKSGQAKVLLVCSRVSSSDDATNAGLDAEISQLADLQQAVQDSGISHVFVYASAPSSATPASPDGKRRSLLALGSASGFGPYVTCDALCRTQVRWLEGMLAVLFLALASCAGLVCLYVLDTPTRFEVPKEGAAQ